MVRVKAVESWIYFEEDHPVGAILVGFFQAFESVDVVFESYVDCRDVVGRKVFLV